MAPPAGAQGYFAPALPAKLRRNIKVLFSTDKSLSEELAGDGIVSAMDWMGHDDPSSLNRQLDERAYSSEICGRGATRAASAPSGKSIRNVLQTRRSQIEGRLRQFPKPIQPGKIMFLFRIIFQRRPRRQMRRPGLQRRWCQPTKERGCATFARSFPGPLLRSAF